MPQPDVQSDMTEEVEPLNLRPDGDMERDDLDMTPMVDVTFLLLIFFMVTAAFSLQKSLEVPTPDREQEATQARTIRDVQEDDDYVIIRIDRDDTIWVNDSKALSEQQVLEKLREAREGSSDVDSQGPSSLLVIADGDCRHETVVMALDAGNAVGMENVRLATADDSEF